MSKKLEWNVFQGLLPVDIHQVSAEIFAGLTLAALAIPETMGYSKIAGMPVVTGIYTMLIPVVLFALFGSSRHLVVGADSATAAILAAGLMGFAKAGSPEYVAYAGLLALMVAVLLILARLIQLGFLADFLSRTVLIGFLTGVGIQVAIGQTAGMLGFSTGENGSLQQLVSTVRQISQTNFYALGISMAVMVIILCFRRISKKIPGGLIAVIGAVIVSLVFNLPEKGVLVLGTIPGGFPMIGLPEINWQFSTIQKLLPTAVSMFVVILAQSAATARAYADRYNERFNENVDLVGLAVANAGAGFSGSFVVNGSPTKTQMVDSAGGRSQLAHLTMAGVVLLVLGFLTGPLTYLPEAVLATVVFMIGLELVDLSGMKKVFTQRPNEFWVALITTAAVVFVGVESGIILAILLSLLEHTRRGYRPKNMLIGIGKAGHWQMAPVASHSQTIPGLIGYRFNHSLYYANCELFYSEVFELVRDADPPLDCFCLDASAIDDVDFSAAESLRKIYRILTDRGIQLVLAGVSEDVRSLMDRYELSEMFGSTSFFDTFGEVVEAYKKGVKSINNESKPRLWEDKGSGS
jgi:high affinity sulfate transporter 1